MNFKLAATNWKNFFRQMVGLPKLYPVKVLRDEKAKQYPLIGIKKDGDVGYDLPSTATITVPAPTEEQRQEYISLMDHASYQRGIGNVAMADIYEEKALNSLPKAMIPTGVKLEMPNSIWCTLEARSSSSKKVLITPDAIIDAGYRGELFAVVFNLGYADYVVEEGERVVQIIFHERILADIIEADELSASERGETGFGSTGLKKS